ncbi:hypothetical protein MTR67_018524 [Solanum verrucosum]|uniref:Uncharacterized protein n=1 Tax=Solanum verrucosum TaxID=315347 RepID=A0AAF0QJV0_SOLVR|nr:hypothetical protein MTR67_018524 [Solanum verrucosum]
MFWELTGLFRRSWASTLTLAQPPTHRLMISGSILFRSFRICCELVSKSLEDNGISLFLWHCVYNNNYHSSIQMALFEALYGRLFCSPVGLLESIEPRLHGTYLIQKAFEQLVIELPLCVIHGGRDEICAAGQA